MLRTQSFMHATMTILHTIVSRDWAEFSYTSIKTLEKLQCYPKEFAYLTSDQSLVSFWASSYFSVCRHFATISDLLFSMSFPSCSAMANFSVRQRAHRLAWHRVSPPLTKFWNKFGILEMRHLWQFSCGPMDRGDEKEHFKPLFRGGGQFLEELFNFKNFVPPTKFSPKKNPALGVKL